MATINLGSIKFNWKGAYNNSTAYAVDDVVSSGGNSYVCIQASTGNAVGNATAYWNIMSSAGAAGAEGGTTTLTTRGDTLYRGASAVARLAKGTAGQVLGQGANDPAWVNGSSSTLTTQGDVLYRDGSGLQRLAKGTAGQALLMNSGANAPEWGAAGGGKVLQVKTVFKSDTYSQTSSSFVTVTGMEIAITPSASNSKILVISNVGLYGGTGYFNMCLSRGDTLIGLGDSLGGARVRTGTAFRMADANSGHGGSILMHMDSPSTTNATTYKLKMYVDYGTCYVGRTSSNGDTDGYCSGGSSIQVMEIGA